jgi:8-oxo-dGTP pyrophosphatase MutT (NUDIX family)
LRWTEEEANIPVRKVEIVGKFNVPFIFREKNIPDFKGRKKPAKRNFQFLESSR